MILAVLLVVAVIVDQICGSAMPQTAEAFAFLVPLAIGAALGAAKHFLADAPAAAAQRKSAAAQTRYSPWTGMGAGQVSAQPSLFGNMLGGAGAGAAFGQQFGAGMGGGSLASQAGASDLMQQAPGGNPWQQILQKQKQFDIA